jgi:hypothetical protein
MQFYALRFLADMEEIRYRTSHIKPFNNYPYENRCGDSHTSLKGVNEILQVFSTFFAQCGYNSIQEIAKKMQMCSVTGSCENRRIVDIFTFGNK